MDKENQRTGSGPPSQNEDSIWSGVPLVAWYIEVSRIIKDSNDTADFYQSTLGLSNVNSLSEVASKLTCTSRV